MNLDATMFSRLFGTVYVAIGLVGFAVTGLSDFAGTSGNTLVIFDLNPLHNVVHLLVGGALLAGAATGPSIARQLTTLVVAIYAVVGVAGFVMDDTSANILALNVADNVLHLVTAAVGTLALVNGRTPAST